MQQAPLLHQEEAGLQEEDHLPQEAEHLEHLEEGEDSRDQCECEYECEHVAVEAETWTCHQN